MPLDIQISITNWPVMLIFEESIWPFSSPLSAKITNIERDKLKRYTERKDFFCRRRVSQRNEPHYENEEEKGQQKRE